MWLKMTPLSLKIKFLEQALISTISHAAQFKWRV